VKRVPFDRPPWGLMVSLQHDRDTNGRLEMMVRETGGVNRVQTAGCSSVPATMSARETFSTHVGSQGHPLLGQRKVRAASPSWCGWCVGVW